jgi:hypothetical protein
MAAIFQAALHPHPGEANASVNEVDRAGKRYHDQTMRGGFRRGKGLC